MLVSTFELLVKPISIPGFGNPAASRIIAQGYFLTIANPNDSEVGVRLQFVATTPNLTIADTITIRDVTGGNIKGDLVATPDPRKLTYDLRIPPQDTALVTLLPDLGKDVLPPFGEPDPVVPNLEIRGYVDISLLSPISLRGVNLLLTPEHRGTFIPQNLAAPNLDFDQLVYSLPTATGSSLFKVGGFLVPVLPISEDLNDTTNSTPAVPLNGIEQMFNEMAERINGLEQRLEAAGKSFISPQGSSVAGDQVVNNQSGKVA
jgi:hypothetical protein